MHPPKAPSLIFALTLFFSQAQAAISDTAPSAGRPSAGRPSAQFTDTVEVSEVLLDVLVTDKKGNVVMGLGVDDFIIKEQGKELQASGLSFYSNRFQIRDNQPEKIQHPAPGEILSDRYFVLFFHDPRAYGVGGQLLRQHLKAARRAREWIQTEKLPSDWVAVASFDYKLKIHQDFTREPGTLERAIDNAGKGKDPSNEWKSRRPEETDGIPSLLVNLPQGKELRKKTTRIYDGLRLLADATHGIIGRKSVLLFTIGFGDVRQTGGLISQPDRRYYPPMKRALNDNNVAIYAVNLQPGSQNLQGHFLTQLAKDTGGEYYETFVNFITPLRQIAKENNGYYLLSYQAEHPAGESGYREVQVRVRNPEFRVKARKGYKYGS
jgi:VWFA-related protein